MLALNHNFILSFCSLCSEVLLLLVHNLKHNSATVCGNRTIYFMNSSTTNNSNTLTLETLNPCIKKMGGFDVEEQLSVRVDEIEKELKSGVTKSFKQVLKANVADYHEMGQKPITFIRQVLALVVYPDLDRSSDFPDDAKSRARDILTGCQGGSIGSYSDSTGNDIIRTHCAEYIQRRDGGIPSDWQNIILGSGSGDCIRNILKLFTCDIKSRKSGVMIPIPQNPFYSAALLEFDLHQIGYYLDEDKNWAIDVSELDRAFNVAKDSYVPRAIVVINPGSPTGQVLTRKSIENIIKFAHERNLIILADEMYQHNVYEEEFPFHSFKKVMTSMGPPYSELELISSMSCSKGYMGECGLRGGYIEILNMDSKVKRAYLKALSGINCPTISGQTVLDVVCNPPRIGETSYKQFEDEKNGILEDLKLKAKMVEETLNSIEGFRCNPVQGAVFAFPRIMLPPMAIEAAKKINIEPDALFALKLLEETGVHIVPGSAFGQRPKTHHFRITILPRTDILKNILRDIKCFYETFVEKYS